MHYRSAFALTKVVVIGMMVILGLAIAVGYVTYQNKILELRESVVVIDRKGAVVSSMLSSQDETRIFEYENHVKTFYKLWYDFDESSFWTNVEAGLELIGEKGKELLELYMDQNIERMLKERSITFKVTIKDIQVDQTSNPVTGIIRGEQTIRRSTGSVTRLLECAFTIYDVDRSSKNPHGCKIGEWEIVNDKIISE